MERKRPLDSEFVMPSFRLDGRAALVTGGGRGLGVAMALALAHAGADIAIAARTESELESTAALIRATGRQALALPGDVGDVEAVRSMVARTDAHFGRLDVLVNAAAVNLRRPADEISVEDWDRILSINLKGAYFAAQEAARIMRRIGRGKIINVSSIAAEIVVPNVSVYAITKGGMRQMTRALAVEMARQNICVNAIAPGRFWTQMTDSIFSNPDLYDSAVSVIPMGRPGLPAELAGATVLLATEASDYITGQTITVDGGWTVGVGVKA